MTLALTVRGRRYWTEAMSNELVRCLTTYRSYANEQELEEMARTVSLSMECVVPAWDSREGRRWRYEQMQPELEQAAREARWRARCHRLPATRPRAPA